MNQMNNKKLNLQLFIYILALPILDILKFFFDTKLEIFNISLIEIVNFIFCFFFLFFVIIKKIREKQKPSIFFIALFITIIIYLIFHLINIENFNVNINGKIDNIFVELYYITRCYIIPCILLYCFSNIDYNRKKIIKFLSFLSFIISIIIVLSNIFNVSFVAYDSYLDSKTLISGNILEWRSLITSETADLFTSKGFFYSPNQLSLILVVLLLISSLHLQDEKRWHLYPSFIIKILAMIMLSTKTCFFGVIITLIFTLIINILFTFIKKEKFNFVANTFFLMCGIASLILFQFSPLSYKMGINERHTLEKTDEIDQVEVIDGDYHSSNLKNYIFNLKAKNNKSYKKLIALLDKFEIYDILQKEDKTESEKKVLLLALTKCNSFFGIHALYKQLFPIEENYDFWVESLNLPLEEREDFRRFKFNLYDYVIKENNNEKNDKLFGIGYISNFPYTETDIKGQYVWFGILGVIVLIIPFYIYFIINIINFLMHLKNNFTKTNIYLLFASFFMLIICLITGHCFGNIFPMSILTIILTLNKKELCINKKLENIEKKRSDNKKNLLFIIWSFSSGGGAEKILSNIVNNLDYSKYNVSVLEYWHSNVKIEKINENVEILKPVVDSTKASRIEKLIKKILVEKAPGILRKIYVPEKYDIEISFNYQIPSFLLSKNSYCISWIHGDIYDLNSDDYKKRLQLKAFNKAKKIVTISENSYNSVVDVFPSQKLKLVKITNGLLLDQIIKQSKEENIKFEKPTFMFLGRLDDNKNPLLLIKIANLIKKRKLDCQIAVFGQGILYDEMSNMIKHNKLDDIIKLMGYTNNPYPYIKKAKAMLLCSKSEGFPTVLLEGIMLDKPFVSTKVGGIFELAENDKCGFVANTEVEFCNNIQKMLEDKNLYNNLVLACKTAKNKYTINTQISKIEELLDFKGSN